jgi:hypothetical protein
VNLTVGELRAQRDAGEADAVLRAQLAAAAAGVPAGRWGEVIVAYEPVWAVGEGASPCSPLEAQVRAARIIKRPWQRRGAAAALTPLGGAPQRVAALLRGWLFEHRGADAAAACRVLYTGSVNAANAPDCARPTQTEPRPCSCGDLGGRPVTPPPVTPPPPPGPSQTARWRMWTGSWWGARGWTWRRSCRSCRRSSPARPEQGKA